MLPISISRQLRQLVSRPRSWERRLPLHSTRQWRSGRRGQDQRWRLSRHLKSPIDAEKCVHECIWETLSLWHLDPLRCECTFMHLCRIFLVRAYVCDLSTFDSFNFLGGGKNVTLSGKKTRWDLNCRFWDDEKESGKACQTSWNVLRECWGRRRGYRVSLVMVTFADIWLSLKQTGKTSPVRKPRMHVLGKKSSCLRMTFTLKCLFWIAAV